MDTIIVIIVLVKKPIDADNSVLNRFINLLNLKLAIESGLLSTKTFLARLH